MSLWKEKPRAILSEPLMKSIILIAALILCSAVAIDGAAPKINYRQKEKQILDEILTGDYDRQIRPSGANGTGPTVVNVNLYVRSISKIDDYNMEYSVQLTFRQQWLDDRLRFNTIKEYMDLPTGKLRYLTLTDSSRIWIPDLFFSNEKQGHLHNLIKPNVYVRIFPDGEVLYSLRVSLTLSCPMMLKLYPMDKQKCSMRMASYGWTTEDIIFNWKKVDPVQVTSDLHLPRFALTQFSTDYCDSQTNTGTYSCLRVDFLFNREFSYYFIQIYIPCVMLVIVSWISFWLDATAVTARVFLGLTTLLTMAVQTSGINQTLPPVSYTKALDVWTGVCLTFVFGALIEFAIVHYVSRWGQQQGQSNLGQAAELESSGGGAGDGRTLVEMKPMGRRPLDHGIDGASTPKRATRFTSYSNIIDVVSRIAFPVIFLLFNIAYWSAYLGKDATEMF